MSAGAVEGLERELSAARRNVFLLTFAQALLASSGPIVFSIGALAGYNLLGEDKSLATAPLTGFNIGVALGAVFVAIAARMLGRRDDHVIGDSQLGEIGAGDDHAAAELTEGRAEFLGTRALVAVVHHDVCAGFGEVADGVCTDAAGRARDEHALAVE